MLADGKEVNYLMLNGEVFGSKKRFPAMYDLGKSYENVQVYKCDINSSSKIVFSEKHDRSVTSGNDTSVDAQVNSISLVFAEQTYNHEKYILLKDSTSFIGTGWEYETNVWVKLKDVGGVLTPAK